MTWFTTWTDERTAQLKALYEEGYSSSQIAAQLGHATRNGVIGKIHRLGLVRDINRVKKFAPRAPRVLKERKAYTRSAPFEAHWQPKVPVEPIEVRCAAVEPLHLSEPEAGKCKYPYGDGPFTFCGHDAAGRTYCALHHELCWIPAKRRPPTYPSFETRKTGPVFMRTGGMA